jgi:hypothetical protein
MSMETTKSAEHRKIIDEQLGIIKSYVDGFDIFLPKDEAALGQIGEIMKVVAQQVKELDEARLKRKRLFGELDSAFSDLQDSQKKFARDVKAR